MKNFKFYFLAIGICLSFVEVKATHNRAGEITYEHIEGKTIKATITIYAHVNSVSADRDSLILKWGDGSEESIPRINGVNGSGVPLEHDYKLNIYILLE